MNSQLLLCVRRETVELLVRKKAWMIVGSGSALLQVGMSSVPYSNLQNVIVHILPVTVPKSTCKYSGLWFCSFQRWKSEPQKNLANFQPILWQILHKQMQIGHEFQLQNFASGIWEIAQWIKAPASKCGHLNLIPEPTRMKESTNFHKLSSDRTFMLRHMCTHT